MHIQTVSTKVGFCLFIRFFVSLQMSEEVSQEDLLPIVLFSVTEIAATKKTTMALFFFLFVNCDLKRNTEYFTQKVSDLKTTYLSKSFQCYFPSSQKVMTFAYLKSRFDHPSFSSSPNRTFTHRTELLISLSFSLHQCILSG